MEKESKSFCSNKFDIQLPIKFEIKGQNPNHIVPLFDFVTVDSNLDASYDVGWAKLLYSGINYDDWVINSGDWIKINVGYSPGSYFYVIFFDSNGMYSRVYSERGLPSDSLYYDTALTWQDFDHSQGLETFYFINSKDKLNELESNFDKYEIARGRIQKRSGIKIQNILDDLSSLYSNDFSISLDAPVMGGVSYRGEGDDELTIYDLTHKCTGNDKIAIRKITLNHK